MIRPLSTLSTVTSPYFWGKVSQDDNTGTITKIYAKTFVKPLPGKFDLFTYKNGSSQIGEYALVGAINSNVRKGLNIPGSDVVIGKLNTDSGAFGWSHIFGFNHQGLIPISDALFPWITKFNTNYFFTRGLILKNPSTSAITNSTVVGKLSGINGTLLKQTMIDGLASQQHSVLQDGSVMIYATTPKNEFIIIKLDNNLNLLWQKKYVSATQNYNFRLFTVGNELPDGTLELVGYHLVNIPAAQLDSHPLIVHISKANGSVVTKREMQFGSKDSVFNGGTRYSDTNTPRALEWLAGNTNSSTPTKRDIVYGEFSQSLAAVWVKTIPGLAPSTSLVVNPYTLQPNDNAASSYRIAGIGTTSISSAVPRMLLGLLDTNGNVPGCTAIRSKAFALITPNIIAQNINALVHPTTVVTDFGALPQVVNATVPAPLTANISLQETSICQ